MNNFDLIEVIAKNIGFRNGIHFKNFIEKACKNYPNFEEILNNEALTKTEKELMEKIIIDYFVDFYFPYDSSIESGSKITPKKS